jgi:hypothetical protein
MLTESTTADGATIVFDHSDKCFHTFDSQTNNILSGDYVAIGGTGRQDFWIDKDTLRAYVPNAIRHE